MPMIMQPDKGANNARTDIKNEPNSLMKTTCSYCIHTQPHFIYKYQHRGNRNVGISSCDY